MPVRCPAVMRGTRRPLFVDLMSRMALALGEEPSVLMETACPWAWAVNRASAKKNKSLENTCFPNK